MRADNKVVCPYNQIRESLTPLPMLTPGQRVLILSRLPLFAQALRYLIENAGLTVVGLNLDTNQALTQIETLQPDIIILDDTELSPLLLKTFLDHAPSVRIICLTLDGNLIRVYDRQQLNANHVQDFVNILNVTE